MVPGVRHYPCVVPSKLGTTHAFFMKSFISGLYTMSSSSSSSGGYRGSDKDTREKGIREEARHTAAGRLGTPTYLILDDVHHQLDRSEIGGEREAIRHELEQCYAGRPHV